MLGGVTLTALIKTISPFHRLARSWGHFLYFDNLCRFIWAGLDVAQRCEIRCRQDREHFQHFCHGSRLGLPWLVTLPPMLFVTQSFEFNKEVFRRLPQCLIAKAVCWLVHVKHMRTFLVLAALCWGWKLYEGPHRISRDYHRNSVCLHICVCFKLSEYIISE